MPRHFTGITILVGAEGALYYRGPTRFSGTVAEGGDLIPIAYPEGATLGSHVFVTGDDGHGVWMTIADFSTLIGAGAGYTYVYLTAIAPDGSTIILPDDSGNPILVYAPI